MASTMSPFVRFFWIGMRSMSLLLTIGILSITIIAVKDERFNWLALVGAVASFSISLPHLLTLPTQGSRNLHAPSPKERLLLDTIAWVSLAYCGAWLVIFRDHTQNRGYYSSVDSEYYTEAIWTPVMVCGALFFFKAALVHLVMAVYDAVDLRRAVVGWDEEFDESKTMSGAMA